MNRSSLGFSFAPHPIKTKPLHTSGQPGNRPERKKKNRDVDCLFATVNYSTECQRKLRATSKDVEPKASRSDTSCLMPTLEMLFKLFKQSNMLQKKVSIDLKFTFQ